MKRNTSWQVGVWTVFIGIAVIAVVFIFMLRPSPIIAGPGNTGLLPGPSSGKDGSLIELFSYVSPSVGALYTQSSGGDLSFTCTVTVIEKPKGKTIFLTAGHCVNRDVAYMVTLDGHRFYSARAWRLAPEKIDKQKNKRKHGEPKVDMALFVVDEELSVNPVPIGLGIPIEPGRKIATVGYPLGVTKVRYSGTIAGHLERPGAEQDGYIILQIFGAPGSSGSAVIDTETARIIGVLVSGKQASAGLPVIFAVPIRYQDYLISVSQK